MEANICRQIEKNNLFVRCRIRTHAFFQIPELASGALDRSANLTLTEESAVLRGRVSNKKRKKKFFVHYVRCRIRTCAPFRVPELNSGALDRSANLTLLTEQAAFSKFDN